MNDGLVTSDLTSANDGWITSNKQPFLNRNDGSAYPRFFEYRNKNPKGIIQVIKICASSPQRSDDFLEIHYNKEHPEELLSVEHQFVLLNRIQWRDPRGPSKEYMNACIGRIHLQAFQPIAQYLTSKGGPATLMSDLTEFSCFKEQTTSEKKYYQDLSKINSGCDEKTFDELLRLAVESLKQDTNACSFSNLLYSLGDRCYQLKLLPFSYRALKEVARNCVYYFQAQLLMGKCLWSKFQSENSKESREMKKLALEHFYEASAVLGEAEGFIQTILTNLTGMAEMDPRLYAISTNDPGQDFQTRFLKKFLYMVDVCYAQAIMIQSQAREISQLKLLSRSPGDTSEMHALSVQFHEAEIDPDAADAADAAEEEDGENRRHKRRAFNKSPATGVGAASVKVVPPTAAAPIGSPQADPNHKAAEKLKARTAATLRVATSTAAAGTAPAPANRSGGVLNGNGTNLLPNSTAAPAPATATANSLHYAYSQFGVPLNSTPALPPAATATAIAVAPPAAHPTADPCPKEFSKLS